jgi:hypothetical protein
MQNSEFAHFKSGVRFKEQSGIQLFIMKRILCALGLHSWEKCTCKYCNKISGKRHNFRSVDEEKHVCTQCGYQAPHHFHDVYEEQHDGAWDSTFGPDFSSAHWESVYIHTECFNCNYQGYRKEP